MCADRFHLFGYGGETDFFSIRRKIDISRPAAFIRWNVVVCSGRKIAWRRDSIRRDHKQMGALAFVPMRPVAIQEMLRHVRFHLILFFFFLAFLVALVVVVYGSR